MELNLNIILYKIISFNRNNINIRINVKLKESLKHETLKIADGKSINLKIKTLQLNNIKFYCSSLCVYKLQRKYFKKWIINNIKNLIFSNKNHQSEKRNLRNIARTETWTP